MRSFGRVLWKTLNKRSRTEDNDEHKDSIADLMEDRILDDQVRPCYEHRVSNQNQRQPNTVSVVRVNFEAVHEKEKTVLVLPRKVTIQPAPRMFKKKIQQRNQEGIVKLTCARSECTNHISLLPK